MSVKVFSRKLDFVMKREHILSSGALKQALPFAVFSLIAKARLREDVKNK